MLCNCDRNHPSPNVTGRGNKSDSEARKPQRENGVLEQSLKIYLRHLQHTDREQKDH